MCLTLSFCVLANDVKWLAYSVTANLSKRLPSLGFICPHIVLQRCCSALHVYMVQK